MPERVISFFADNKLTSVAIATSLGSIPLQDVNESGALISIIISIFSGILALIKHFRKPKP